jgi:hypothetical protein
LRRSRIEAEIAVDSALRRSRIEAEVATESALRRSRVEAELAASRLAHDNYLRSLRIEADVDRILSRY